MEVEFRCKYGSISSVIENVYKPFLDFHRLIFMNRRDKAIINAGINKFRNELLLPEICNPNFVGFNSRYICADKLKDVYFKKVSFAEFRKIDVPIMIPSPPRLPRFKTTFRDYFLEV